MERTTPSCVQPELVLRAALPGHPAVLARQHPLTLSNALNKTSVRASEFLTSLLHGRFLCELLQEPVGQALGGTGISYRPQSTSFGHPYPGSLGHMSISRGEDWPLH